jgi:hypothetical protein
VDGRGRVAIFLIVIAAAIAILSAVWMRQSQTRGADDVAEGARSTLARPAVPVDPAAPAHDGGPDHRRTRSRPTWR